VEKLKRVYIEITNICNLNCSFCPPCPREKRTMTVREFEYILNQVKPTGAQIYLHVKGEPLLHPELDEILTLALQYDIPANLTTNGTLLMQNRSLLLGAPSLRQVNISLHSQESGYDPEYLETAAQFGIDAAKQGHPIVSYRLWNGEPGASMDQNSLFALNTIAAFFGQSAEDPKRGREAAKFAQNVYAAFEEQFEWPAMDAPEIAKRGKCLGGREMLAVLCGGTVVPCCLDDGGVIALGNIFKTDLERIMDTPRYKALVAGFCGGNISEPLCRRCRYRTRFERHDATCRRVIKHESFIR